MLRRFLVLMALTLATVAPAAADIRSDQIPQTSVPATFFSVTLVLPSAGFDGPAHRAESASRQTTIEAQSAPGQRPTIDTASAGIADQTALKINEFMADNVTTLEDPDSPGAFPDWIELYNPSPDPIDLGGLYLTDDFNNPTQFRITDSLVISAGGYLLFYADNDPEQGPTHTNFRLSAQGEVIGLFDRDINLNQPLDTLTFGPQATDVSLGRCPDGGADWYPLTSPTPGASNEPCGPAPVITSVVHTPTLPYENDPVTVTAVITDDLAVISATLYYSAGLSFVPLEMTSAGDDAYSATIPSQLDGTWVAYYVRAEDSVGLATVDPPGAPANAYRYLVGYQPPTVFLNEFMADNVTTLEDPDSPGAFPDWIELYNPSPDPIDLGGLYLTDDLSDPTQFRITDSLVISPGGYLLFYADNDPEQGPTHTNFGLNANGEAIGLFGAEGTVEMDAVVFPAQPADRSYGRLPDGTGVWGFQDCRTPGRSNEECYPIFLPLTAKGLLAD